MKKNNLFFIFLLLCFCNAYAQKKSFPFFNKSSSSETIMPKLWALKTFIPVSDFTDFEKLRIGIERKIVNNRNKKFYPYHFNFIKSKNNNQILDNSKSEVFIEFSKDSAFIHYYTNEKKTQTDLFFVGNMNVGDSIENITSSESGHFYEYSKLFRKQYNKEIADTLYYFNYSYSPKSKLNDTTSPLIKWKLLIIGKEYGILCLIIDDSRALLSYSSKKTEGVDLLSEFYDNADITSGYQCH